MKIIILILLSLSMCSCAVNYHMHDNHFETPETTGAYGKVAAIMGVGNGKKIELTPDYTYTWASTQNPKIVSEGFFTAGGTLGLQPDIDLGLSYISNLGVVLKGKYQALGKRGEVGPQVAGVLEIGGANEEKNESTNSMKLENSMYGANLIAGYRFGVYFLSYFSIFRDNAKYDLKQTKASITQSFKGDSSNTGAAVGVELDLTPSAGFILEFTRAKADSANSKIYTSSFGGTLNILLF
ncbi:MAG: hypothetical protein Q7U04_15930 [Bacteriovorax sp.]|nr:hypothetical protein [Bacteriovorax sp.]